jgi:hypothetical protein
LVLLIDLCKSSSRLQLLSLVLDGLGLFVSDLSLCQQLHFLLLILLNYNNLLACTSENKSNISCLLFSLDKENRLRCWKCCKSSSTGGG